VTRRPSHFRIAILLFAANLAACSTIASAPPSAVPGDASLAARHDYTGPLKMLKLQIAGKMPSALRRGVLKHILGEIRNRQRPRVRFDPNAAVGMWVSDGYFGYIFGQNKKGNVTVTAIDTVANGCYYNYGIKVDHAQNLWTSCYNNAAAQGGAVQKYARGSGTPAATYDDSFACGSGCAFYGFANDVATDSKGHVFAANLFSESCASGGCTYSTYPVTWWNAGASGTSPSGIADSNLQYAYYLDTDRSGNVYVSGYGCTSPSDCGYLVDEIKHPASANPAIVNLIPPGTTYLQGLSVSNGGKMLNVVEPDAREVARYALPFAKSEKPAMLGPTIHDYAGVGSPIDGAFTVDDSRMVLGDAWGWLDSGDVARNKWTGVVGINVNQDNLSVAPVPSDR
jgi:hypothetical protein